MHNSALIEKLLTALPIGAALLDPATGRHVFANAPYKRLFAGDDPVGRTVSEIWPSCPPELQEALSTEGPMRDHPIQHQGRNLALRVATLDPHASQGGVVLLVCDALPARPDVDLDRLLAVVSHELRNPLNVMQSAFYLAQRTPGDDPRHARALERLDRSIAHQVQLLNDLQEYSRLSRGLEVCKQDAVLVEPLVRKAVESQAAPAPEQDISLDLQCEPDLWVQGDAARLQRSIAALIANACRLVPTPRHLQIRAIASSDAVEVQVHDEDAAVDPDELARCFEPFSTTSKGAASAKLDLGLIKLIVELHRGRVQARNLGPGNGCVWSMILPRSDGPTSQRAQKQVTVQPGADLAGVRILVVDDSRDQRVMIGKGLELSGLVVFVAASGAEALASLQANHPDVVLADMQLPDMDGFELLRRMRDIPSMHGTPVIAVTGWSAQEMEKRALDAGFAAFVVKPVDLRTLKQLIASKVAR